MKILILLMLFSSAGVNSQWEQVYGSPYVYCLGTQGNNIFAGTGFGLFISTNNGSNWLQTSLSGNTHSLISSQDIIIAGTSTGIFRSTNNGNNWLGTNINSQVIRSLAVSSGYFYAGRGSDVLISSNNGANWLPASPVSSEVYALAVNGNYVYAGTYSTGVFVSSNNGFNWSPTSLNNNFVSSLAVAGGFIYAGTNSNGVYVSSNNGVNWAQSLPGKNIKSLTVSENSVFAGSDSGVYVTDNNGSNWLLKNEGLGNYLSIGSQCIVNGFVFAAKEPISGAGIFRRPLSELIGITQITSEVPTAFSLLQNYPNPFNPTTSIEFSIPKAAFVKLIVYDISGREVETLVSQNMSAGLFNADWDAAGYSSGVYFYTIEAELFRETKRMILVK